MILSAYSLYTVTIVNGQDTRDIIKQYNRRLMAVSNADTIKKKIPFFIRKPSFHTMRKTGKETLHIKYHTSVCLLHKFSEYLL